MNGVPVGRRDDVREWIQGPLVSTVGLCFLPFPSAFIEDVDEGPWVLHLKPLF